MSEAGRVVLRAGRERSVGLGHPWILSGSIDQVEGHPAPGDVVLVVDARGHVLAQGDYDPGSQITVRIFAFADGSDPDEKWVRARIGLALGWRATEPSLQNTDAMRLVHAEADGLPGLIVDRYADWLTVKLQTPAMQRRAHRIAQDLEEFTGCKGAWLRGADRAKKQKDDADEDGEGEQRALFGEVPEEVTIHENGREYLVDLRRGQKTGFFLDQRDSRELFQSLAAGGSALDLFSHTGGFAAAALAGGAKQVVAVESSRRAAALLGRNAPRAELVQGDVGDFLRHDTRSFDLIALDPPALAKRKKDVKSACRAYKDLNLHALRHAAPGAHLLTFSCSHHLETELFRKVVFGAALDADREVQVLAQLGAPPDHPVSIRHPQGEYLKGLLLRVGGAA